MQKAYKDIVSAIDAGGDLTCDVIQSTGMKYARDEPTKARALVAQRGSATGPPPCPGCKCCPLHCLDSTNRWRPAPTARSGRSTPRTAYTANSSLAVDELPSFDEDGEPKNERFKEQLEAYIAQAITRRQNIAAVARIDGLSDHSGSASD